ncbi:hypothetical protein A4A59_009515 [Rhizobium leguminosarum]|uniref:Uncharacterized protein n=1 Tax=Rhizobium leguminosarum TaxID=384 RepID=A0ACD5F9M9_RHILE|nr:hypothetical protein [Rhizobium leguminosarum]
MFIVDCLEKNRGENRRGSIKKQVPDLVRRPSAASFLCRAQPGEVEAGTAAS